MKIIAFFLIFLPPLLPASPSNMDLLQDPIQTYFNEFETLAEQECWQKILSIGNIAIDAAKKTGDAEAEAKICAQLTSTCFYLGDYDQAILYASRCHQLSDSFSDPHLLLRALYLESAIYRALGSKAAFREEGQNLYAKAVDTAQQAANIYATCQLNDLILLGKIYYNLGAAHADNPEGNLNSAIDCYLVAAGCFQEMEHVPDQLRTSIRLAKVYLLQKKYSETFRIIEEVRPYLPSERISMQLDYLEAQAYFAIGKLDLAACSAQNGLDRAKALGAKEDELRLATLLEKIEQTKKLP